MLHKKVNMFIRSVIFCSVLSLTVSEEISPSKNTSIPDNQTLPNNLKKRAEPLAINISDLLRHYAREVSNSSRGFPSSSASSGKKAYIQDETQTPSTPNQNPTGGIGGIGGIFDSGPNGNLFGQVTVTDLIPYIVENVLSPLIQRVLVEGNLVNNVYSLFRGVSEGGATQASVPAREVAAVEATPEKQYVVDIAVEEETTTSKPSSPPKRRRTRGYTTTTTEKSGIPATAVKGDLTESEGSATTSRSKYKLIHRTRTRASSTSTQKTFEDNQDDEDETLVFNKLTHL